MEGAEGRSKDLIPGKCFLLFQDHGLAHVQPQTQCTIAGAAREERAEGNKIRKRKKALGIQMQTTASITDTGARGNISSDKWVTGITWALLRTHAVFLGGLCSEYSGPLQVFPEVMSSFIGILSVKQLNIMMLWCHGDIVSQTLQSCCLPKGLG